jgi:hypothetical protein
MDPDVKWLLEQSREMNMHSREVFQRAQMLANMATETARRAAELVVEARQAADAADEFMDRAETLIWLNNPPKLSPEM